MPYLRDVSQWSVSGGDVSITPAIVMLDLRLVLQVSCLCMQFVVFFVFSNRLHFYCVGRGWLGFEYAQQLRRESKRVVPTNKKNTFTQL